MVTSVQFSSVAQSCLTLWTPWTAARQASLSITNSWSPPKPISIESVMPSNHLTLISSPPPPALNLSQHQGLFQWVSSSLRWPKYWSFSFNISPSKEHPGLISFRIDWLDLLAVQGTLKSLLQHHSSKADGDLLIMIYLIHINKGVCFPGSEIAIQSSVCCSTIRKRNTAL